jgi:phage terminase large subunit
VQIEIPETLAPLFEPRRYKVLYGGRGGGKSENIARALLVMGMQKPIRVLCAREFQNSITESVHQTLAGVIRLYELEAFYEIQASTIKGINGTEFVFKGIKHNYTSLKSYQGVDICWIEEAANVSKASWDVIVPTIRKEGSEIWISFNPNLEDDETYQRFVVSPPPDSWVLKVNWDANPWFPDVLKAEKDHLKAKDPQAYKNVWEGHCKQSVDGAIFANEIAKAIEEHRITRVPVKEGIPVHTFWDLGHSDKTAIWFVQLIGLEYRLLDYYEASGEKMPHYIKVLADRAYQYGEHCLPHDADNEQLAANATIRQQLQNAIKDNPALGKVVRVVPRIPKKALGIDAARSIFDQCLFDKDKTAAGLQCLRRYAYARDDQSGKISKEPRHDVWSHGSDAFLCFAQHFKRPQHTEYKSIMIS